MRAEPSSASRSPLRRLAELRIVVVDYESGNLRSVAKALEREGLRCQISSDAESLDRADALILPGVGAGDSAMAALRRQGLVEPLRQFAASGRPFLGVCLGLQLLMDRTEEGDAQCLGIIPGTVKRLPAGLKVPHMGWNQVRFAWSHPVFAGIPEGAYFYFVHSYYAHPADKGVVLGTTEYGVSFCSVIARDNLVATQFHPEKSGPAGLAVYRNFLTFAAALAEKS